MIKKFRHWLIERFMPVYLRESLLEENRRLEEQNKELKVHIEKLNAYIDGLENGIKAQRRIVINTGEVKK